MSVYESVFGVVLSSCSAVWQSAQVEVAFLCGLGMLLFVGHVTGFQVRGVGKGKGGGPWPAASRPRRDTCKAVPAHASHRVGQPAPERANGTHWPREQVHMGKPDSISPTLLCDPAWVAPHITKLCNSHVQQALDVYHAARRAGLAIQKIAPAECDQAFVAMITSAVRVGRAPEALQLMRDLRQHGPGVSSSLVTSVTKLCASKQLFADCLAIFDFVTEDPACKICDVAAWSCLLFAAIETKSFDRCKEFFSKLKSCGQPSQKDYGNMIRYASVRVDWQLSIALLQEMREHAVEVDCVAYNTALAVCVGADQLSHARELLNEMSKMEGVADVITYNTVIKGHARVGKVVACFDLYRQMRTRGIAASQVTYGILLDTCINDNQMDRAAEVYTDIVKDKCEMNTILYTTLIKGFAKAGRVQQAMEVYEKMLSESTVLPDLITFSIIIKANCDASRFDAALKLLETMLGLGLKPDEVLYNNLLGGCVKEANVELAKRLYKDMLAGGIRPSCATFSILIRLYAESKRLDEAIDLLRTETVAQSVVPEPRLFSQLAQCCLRERQGRRTVEVYKMMLERATPTAAMNSSLLGLCVKLNMLDTAVEIIDFAVTSGGRLDARDIEAVLEAARKKKKAQVAEACLSMIARMRPRSGA